jgi:putative flavoprotein involved in K+ transport
MRNEPVIRPVPTVVIGGGQAGLAVGYYLRQHNDDFVILDASPHVGHSWASRWDSLRLFTPAQYDGLPGLPFPAPKGSFPTKDEVAAYLQAYARHFDLPVRCGVRVEGLSRTASGYRVQTSAGAYEAKRVVLSTGTNPLPRTPDFAGLLDPSIQQLHSHDYRGPASVRGGRVLVVGAGTSGVQIALDLVATHEVRIAGKPTPHIPDVLLNYAGGLYWWLISHLLTVRTPMGRKAQPQIRGGGAPLIHVSVADLDRAGIERLPRVAGVQQGLPVLDDGRVLEVDAVLWATGFRPDFSWVEFPITDDSGWPSGPRGVSEVAPGLYFVGMPFQFGLTSGLIGGMGRDAAHVAEHIVQSAARLPPA